mmetsp:Transcript_58946/g.108912  ORF Transcript_58946/g.108912 Transcript_58946/m.108912 type:complete len:355 (+) Transcript_58946:85-1149(+)
MGLQSLAIVTASIMADAGGLGSWMSIQPSRCSPLVCGVAHKYWKDSHFRIDGGHSKRHLANGSSEPDMVVNSCPMEYIAMMHDKPTYDIVSNPGIHLRNGGIKQWWRDFSVQDSFYINFLQGVLWGSDILRQQWLDSNKYTGIVPVTLGNLASLGSLWSDDTDVDELTPWFLLGCKITGELPLLLDHSRQTESTSPSMGTFYPMSVAFDKFHDAQAYWQPLHFLDATHSRFAGSILTVGDATIEFVCIQYNSHEGFHLELQNAIENSDLYTKLYATGKQLHISQLSGPLPKLAYTSRAASFGITCRLSGNETDEGWTSWTDMARFSTHDILADGDSTLTQLAALTSPSPQKCDS